VTLFLPFLSLPKTGFAEAQGIGRGFVRIAIRVPAKRGIQYESGIATF
jgi:hypothetical protein